MPDPFPAQNTQELRLYYSKYFDFNKFWDTFGSKERVFVFVYSNPGVETYTPARTFPSVTHFKRAVMCSPPSAIHMGAKKDCREFVLDFDLSDASVRTCCGTEKRVCAACMPILNMLNAIIPVLLACVFGWVHVLTVFSGRRGLHFIVLDESACTLTRTGREAALSYLDACLSDQRPWPGSGYFSFVSHMYAMYAGDLADMLLGDREGKLSHAKLSMCMGRLRTFLATNNYPRFNPDVLTSVSATIARRSGACVGGLSARCAMQILIQLLDQRFDFLSRAFLVCHLRPVFDRPVTVNAKHLFKAPFSPHASSSCISYIVSPEQRLCGLVSIESVLDGHFDLKARFSAMELSRVVPISKDLPCSKSMYDKGTESGAYPCVLGSYIPQYTRLNQESNIPQPSHGNCNDTKPLPGPHYVSYVRGGENLTASRPLPEIPERHGGREKRSRIEIVYENTLCSQQSRDSVSSEDLTDCELSFSDLCAGMECASPIRSEESDTELVQAAEEIEGLARSNSTVSVSGMDYSEPSSADIQQLVCGCAQGECNCDVFPF